MVSYPIRVARSGYRGNDAKKRAKAADENRMASLIEDFVNGKLLAQEEPVQQYGWCEIAQGTGLRIEDVARIGFSIDCGSNGFTAIRQGLTLEQAAAEAQSRAVARSQSRV